jgi:hypothetical protein
MAEAKQKAASTSTIKVNKTSVLVKQRKSNLMNKKRVFKSAKPYDSRCAPNDEKLMRLVSLLNTTIQINCYEL